MKHIRYFVLAIFCLSALFSCASGRVGAPAPSMLRESAEPDMEEDSYESELSYKMEEMDDREEMKKEDSATMATASETPVTESKPEAPGEPEPGIEIAEQLATRTDYREKAPELLARYDGPDMAPLPFRVLDIHVVIAGHRARVLYDMVFENPHSSTLSGTMMVNLPDGASPSYLAMYLGTGSPVSEPLNILNPLPPNPEELLAPAPVFGSSWQTQSGEIPWGELRAAKVVNPVQGREVYEKVTRQRVDPALAEWAGGNKFSTRVYPIPPNSYKRILFAYDRPLETVEGLLIYPLPYPVNPPATTRIRVYNLDQSLKGAKLLAGKNEVPALNVPGGTGWLFRPGADFSANIVFSAQPEDSHAQIIAGTDPAVEGKLVHVRYTPNLPDTIDQGHTGKALFLLDTSYSGRDKLYSLSGKMLRSILEQDTGIKSFAVVAFDVLPSALHSGFLENNKANREAALSSIESLWLEGATNFSGVLEYLRHSPLFAEADSLFLLSDGQITWGDNNTRTLTTHYEDVLNKPWNCYAFGDGAVNRELYNRLSLSGGKVINIGPGQELAKAALFHRKPAYRLNYLTINNGLDILVTGEPRFIYPGQVLEIGARVFDQEKSLKFTINIEGTEKPESLPIREIPAANHLAIRSWAGVYVNHLLGLYDRSADEAALALSQHFSLTNRQASFIILETDEEYVTYGMTGEMLNLEKVMEAVMANRAGQPYGAPDISSLDSATLTFLDQLEMAEGIKVYEIRSPEVLREEIRSLISAPPGDRGKNTPAELYQWAMDTYNNRKQVVMGANKALRILSTIIEEKPADDQAARLTGYVLMEWGMFREAAELFAAIRQRRPFEPQNYLIEALALTFLGNLKEAALRYEIVLQGDFPRFNNFVKPVAAVLYSDLLRGIMAREGLSSLGRLCREKSGQLESYKEKKGRLVLFWNLDDTDVDLHVKEGIFTEVFYSNPRSLSGGHLLWDNTTGLGPEMYEHPSLSDIGYNVFVNYFGSNSVEGAAPSATLVCAINYRDKPLLPVANCYSTILMSSDEEKIQIMPRWMRMK